MATSSVLSSAKPTGATPYLRASRSSMYPEAAASSVTALRSMYDTPNLAAAKAAQVRAPEDHDALLALVGASVMVMFSALVDGLGDVGLLTLSALGLLIGRLLAQSKGWTIAGRVLSELLATLKPELTFAWISGHGTQLWSPYVTAAATVTLALALAILAVNRRELSYAAG